MLSRLHPRPAVPEPDQGPPDQPEAARLVENAVRDHFDHFLSRQYGARQGAARRGHGADGRAPARKAEREIKRKTATSASKLRLPGKLTDCSGEGEGETELFIVEGDSAGGSAKQARNRKTQAILPIRGKILNVASRHRRQDPRQSGNRRSRAGAGLRHAQGLRPRQSALRPHHHHDRRRCRRRAYRHAADDVLLPGNARSRAGAGTSSSPSRRSTA